MKKHTFKKYKSLVLSATRRQNIQRLENYSKRGSTGKKGAYHLDHIYSIKQGYENNISPDVIGNISNLRFIPWEDNAKKAGKLTDEGWDMFSYFIESEMI
jgi:hypothetical protein